MPAPVDQEFQSTERFSIRRRLGAGAFGVVYEAFDRERQVLVALKTLRHASVEALYRLKREFRALSDIAHPNLVALYEMLASDDQWFFTMELVEGTSFLHYVRPALGRAPPDGLFGRPLEETRDAPIASLVEEGADTRNWDSVAAESGLARSPEPPVSVSNFDPDRLRRALLQAVCGLNALHAAGKLHRDIKPSNVLVSREGRLVLLDFGLVTELSPAAIDESLSLVGTPPYMSPEQCSNGPISSASDWYSLGVMLFEALTGRLPFTGTVREMMWDKRHAEPPPPRDFCPGVPDDLNDLCRDLLRSDPEARPSGAAILRCLRGAEPTIFEVEPVRPVPIQPAPFIGRHAHLNALQEALENVQQGRAVTVYVHGTSGTGKTALVRQFLEGVRDRENVVILAGRCYEQESVPYKALDSLIDSLSHYLKRLPLQEAEALLPRDIVALTRVFPVLRRVEAVAGARRKIIEIPDSFELRRRAFAALRELLGRLADRRDLILFIDDLQWGDIDSATLLAGLMRPPDPPPLLMLACYRTEEAGTSPLLQRLLPQKTAADSADIRQLAVEDLPATEARDLARALLGDDPKTSALQADAIARESRGNPFFIGELVRYSQAHAEFSGRVRIDRRQDDASPRRETTLDEVIRARILRLNDKSRRLLEVVALAGQPIDVDVASNAAESKGEMAISTLRAGHLVRLRGTSDRQKIEPYHDRIREAAVAHLSVESLTMHHRRLALALEASGRADRETLALHFREAGQLETAAEHSAVAADRAAETLAFDRAARLYRLALELGVPGDTQVRRSLSLKLGDSLANAGRGAEAAKAYLAAAEGASTRGALELQRRAAAQLLRSGHLDEALPLFELVLGRIGLTLIQPSWRTLLQFLFERVFIRLRGLNFRERDETEVSSKDLLRLDTYWTLATGLSLINTIRGKEFQNRHLLLALRLGEPYRVCLAIAAEAAYSATDGCRKRQRSAQHVSRSMELAQRVQHPHAIGCAHSAAFITAFFEGRWKDCWEHSQTAEAILRERCTGVSWELDLAHILSLRALYYLGGIKELALRLPVLIREARERDDLLAATGLRVRYPYPQLAADEPDQARRNVNEALDEWSHEGFHTQNFRAMIADAEIALFEQDPMTAWGGVSSWWQALKRSRLLRVQLFRIEAWNLRARSALLAASESKTGSGKQKQLLRSSEQDANRIESEDTPWGCGLAELLRAGIAAARQSRVQAKQYLVRAVNDFETADMALYAAAARRRLSELEHGDEARALLGAADAWMARQQIKNPARMTAMLIPGTWS